MCLVRVNTHVRGTGRLARTQLLSGLIASPVIGPCGTINPSGGSEAGDVTSEEGYSTLDPGRQVKSFSFNRSFLPPAVSPTSQGTVHACFRSFFSRDRRRSSEGNRSRAVNPFGRDIFISRQRQARVASNGKTECRGFWHFNDNSHAIPRCRGKSHRRTLRKIGVRRLAKRDLTRSYVLSLSLCSPIAAYYL